MSLRNSLDNTENERLTLRSLNRFFQQAMRKSEAAPYSTKKAFVIGLSGKFATAREWNEGWNLYHTTLSSPCDKPAMFYKLREAYSDISEIYNQFTHKMADVYQQENIKRMGLRYSPPNRRHTWALNVVWVLAQIHRGRSIVILTDVLPKYKRRKDLPKGHFSAFALEIMTVMKAGYQININHQRLNLSAAPLALTRNHISIDTLKLNPSDEQRYDAVAQAAYEAVPRNILLMTDQDDFVTYLSGHPQQKNLLNLYFETPEFAAKIQEFIPDYEDLINIAKKDDRLADAILNHLINSMPDFFNSIPSLKNYKFMIVFFPRYQRLFERLITHSFKNTELILSFFETYPHDIQSILGIIHIFKPALKPKLLVPLLIIANDEQTFNKYIKNNATLMLILKHYPSLIDVYMDRVTSNTEIFSRFVPSHLEFLALCLSLPTIQQQNMFDVVLSNREEFMRIFDIFQSVLEVATKFLDQRNALIATLLSEPSYYAGWALNERQVQALCDLSPALSDNIKLSLKKKRPSRRRGFSVFEATTSNDYLQAISPAENATKADDLLVCNVKTLSGV